MTERFIDSLETDLGHIEIQATATGITSIVFTEQAVAEPLGNQHTDSAKQQLQEYLYGQRQQFSLPLSPSGTDFQQQVWRALLAIPFGCTASYADIANTIGNPKAVRAVGAANGKNPISIVIPCHRIIGKDGSLTGYAGGMARKSALLKLEH